jgi:hypothetical protein
LLRRYDGITFAPRLRAFKTGCADGYVRHSAKTLFGFNRKPCSASPKYAMSGLTLFAQDGSRVYNGGDNVNSHRVDLRLELSSRVVYGQLDSVRLQAASFC